MDIGERIIRRLLTISGLFMIVRALTTSNLHFLFYPAWVVIAIATGVWILVDTYSNMRIRFPKIRFIAAGATITISVWRIAAHVAAGTSFGGEPIIDGERVISVSAAWIVIGTYTSVLSVLDRMDRYDR
jgi:uncharacterized membrane protein YcfT